MVAVADDMASAIERRGGNGYGSIPVQGDLLLYAWSCWRRFVCYCAIMHLSGSPVPFMKHMSSLSRCTCESLKQLCFMLSMS